MFFFRIPGRAGGSVAQDGGDDAQAGRERHCAFPLGQRGNGDQNSAIWRHTNENKVPQLFVSSGATKWDDPKPHRRTMGFGVGHQIEGRICVAFILKHKPDARIGVLYQNDEFGKDYLKGLVDGLGSKAESMIKVKASCQTTDPTVDSQVLEMQAAGCDVCVNVAIPKFAAQAIRNDGRGRMEAAVHLEWRQRLGGSDVETGGSRKCQGHH
jgi:ABC-type branched-subunit amino acid transport system substrate-binding protein